MIRKIVAIDDEKCDGCGQCVPACVEGAIRLEAGKARLSSDVLCDGLGACLGECPRGAITIVEREAEAFLEVSHEAAVARLVGHRPALSVVPPLPEPAGCPGSRAMSWGDGSRGAPPAQPRVEPCPPLARDSRPRLAVIESANPPRAAEPLPPAANGSKLGQWPVQLHLVSTGAPYFQNADLLVAADCVPFAYARFHEDLLDGRRVVIGCPKLDDNRFYLEKLTELFRRSSVRSVTVAKMRVPCCAGIAWAARQALAAAGRNVPYREVTVGVRGEIL
jgi:NAD-dependent dihydropyrimidine dehydrogenase PreA subunit